MHTQMKVLDAQVRFLAGEVRDLKIQILKLRIEDLTRELKIIKQQLTLDWEESKHPRDPDGKFTNGSGTGKISKESGVSKTGKKHPVKINGYGNANIPEAKLTKYALNPFGDPDKAIAFEKALGYNLGNYEKLVENIRKNINKYPVVRGLSDFHGDRFSVTLDLKGENGKVAKVLTGWLVDAKNGEVRLTTIHIKKRKK